MRLETCRKWLIGIWGIGFLIPFILIIFQNFNGKYGNKDSEVLGWLTTLTLPTLLLMFGFMLGNPAAAADGTKGKNQAEPDEEKTEAERAKEIEEEQAAKAKAAHENFVFRLAAAVSIVYFLIIILVFFFEPFSESKPQELMRDYKIYLAVFDSILSLLIGYFFGKR